VRYDAPQPFLDLEHTADVGVEVEGASAEEVLARLVLAQSALLAGGAAVPVEREETVRVPAGRRVAMAVSLLRELLFRCATERVLAVWCDVCSFDERSGAELRVGLGRLDPELHAEGLDLKAVTWHQARLEQDAGRWRGRIVFDI
jgi:SHS2 domain-containing protein